VFLGLCQAAMTRARFNDQDESGQIFGAFRLVKQIAVGGMAEIYLAKAKGIGGFEKHLALKMIHPNFSEDEHFITMLIEEAKISVQLTHANIAQTFDLGKINETYYIAMEWIDGADLYKLLRRASERNIQVPIEVAAYIAQEVCAGLDYAHRKTDEMGRPLNIIHRDISPQNVLLSYAGEVKVVDFGIAKAAHRAAQTAAGVIKGKYYYMSPEQAWGETLDQRSDIFSTGIILYESLTGQMLYLEENILRLLDMVRKADIASPRVLRSDVPAALERIVMKALSRKPDDRWQVSGDFSAALSKFLYGFAPDFTAARLSAFMRRVLLEEDVVGKGASLDESRSGEVMSRIDFSADEEAVHSVIADVRHVAPPRPRSRRNPEDATAQVDSLPVAMRRGPQMVSPESDAFSLAPESVSEDSDSMQGSRAELPSEPVHLPEGSGTLDFESRSGDMGTGSNQVDEDETRLDAVDLPSMLAGRAPSRGLPQAAPAKAAPVQRQPVKGPPSKGGDPLRESQRNAARDVSREQARVDSTKAAVPSARSGRPKGPASEQRSSGRQAAQATPPLRPREEELAWDEDAPTRYHEHRGRGDDAAEAPPEPAAELRSSRGGRAAGDNGARPAPASPPAAVVMPPPGGMPPPPADPSSTSITGEPAREWWMPAPQPGQPGASARGGLPSWRWLAAGIAAAVVALVVLVLLVARPEAPTSGSIDVSSEPKGALITHNGVQLAHRTPHRLVGLDLKATHVIEVWLPSYERSRHQLSFQSNSREQSVFARLRPETGRLLVESRPPGAELTVNGQRVGLTPWQLESLPLGTDPQLELKLPGYAVEKRAVPWAGQRAQKVLIDLRPTKPARRR
jgi:serine/threonine-protein kinase